MPHKGETESQGNATTYSACIINKLVAKLGLEKGTTVFRPVSQPGALLGLCPEEEVDQDAQWLKMPNGSQCSPAKMEKTCSEPRRLQRPAPEQQDNEDSLG